MTQLRQRNARGHADPQFLGEHPQSYLQQVSLFARPLPTFSGGSRSCQHPNLPVYLTNEKKLAPGSILIATSALRFLYTVTLKRPWDVAEVLRCRRSPKHCR